MVEVLIQNGGTQTDHEDSQCTHMVMLSLPYWITFFVNVLVLCSTIIIIISQPLRSFEFQFQQVFMFCLIFVVVMIANYIA